MKQLLLAMALASVTMAGCGGGQASAELDKDPTILGFTPALRAQMREVIKEQDPAADANKVVDKYMDQLRKIAADLKAEPNAAGDIALPAEKFGELDISKLREKGGPLEGIKILKEFDVAMPGWSSPLVQSYQAGTISPEREELLIAVVTAEIVGVVRNLSK